jgi:asparagine synthase (glutamine-hydrolysing)
MCGIIGLYGDYDSNKFISALDKLKHRGEDDIGHYFNAENNIALGHTRLSILDTSSLGHQPMLSFDEKVILIFNGEVFNFKELRNDLESKGYEFIGNSDTEVLLNLYLSEGIKMLTKINGIFAFALVDLRSKELFLARDALGVKPLYFSSNGNNFAFSSEIKAIIDLIPNDKKIDAKSIELYLSFLSCYGDGTPIESIKKILPGEVIKVKDGEIKEKWYWYKLPIHNKKNSLNKIENISGVENCLRQAVHRQMISDVPLGAFLSGGLDSSSIVTFAKEINPEIKCFSIQTLGKQDKGFIDDLPYAKQVAKHLNVSLDLVSIESSKMANDLEEMIIQLDEPIADPAALNVLYISRLAREQGIKVLLSGVGGDDLFSGYRRHVALKLDPYWSWLPESARKRLESLTANLNANNSTNRRISKIFNGASLSETDRLINYFRWSDDVLLRSLYTVEFRQKLKGGESNSIMKDFLEQSLVKTSALDQMLALEQRFFLADHNLNYTDKMSMAVGVEVRVPFLDLDLVDFASKIPTEYKQRGWVSKWILKKAMEPYLPKDIIYRHKTGFGVPLRQWIQSDLKEIMRDLLSIDSVNRRGFFRAENVQKLILDNSQGRVDASYTLFSLLCIEIWCRAYLD